MTSEQACVPALQAAGFDPADVRVVLQSHLHLDHTGALAAIDQFPKVWPRDVEDVLCAHEAVREAAVVGVPDEYRGETVKAFVSLKPEQSVTEETLIGVCKERMAAYKYPRQIEFVEELPKTASGKILRRELREREVSRSRG